MRRIILAAGVALALALFAGTASAGDADVFRLDLKKGATASTLGLDGGADVTLARGYRNWYGHHHHYRPYYNHHYYRPFYGNYHSYYPRYFNYSFYPRYNDYYYPRSFGFSFGYSYYQPSYYYTPPVYYYSAPLYYTPPSYYCPISLSFALGSASGSLSIGPRGEPAPPPMERIPPAEGTPGNGTYPYDGGPAAPVPMPKATPAPPVPMPNAAPAPRTTPPVTVPADGRFVSLPAAKSTKFAYPAYGEDTRATSFAADRVARTKTELAKKDGK